jgi:hypothetical protein
VRACVRAAPDHGSVWAAGAEHRVATPSGAVPGDRVAVTCHAHYRCVAA